MQVDESSDVVFAGVFGSGESDSGGGSFSAALFLHGSRFLVHHVPGGLGSVANSGRIDRRTSPCISLLY